MGRRVAACVLCGCRRAASARSRNTCGERITSALAPLVRRSERQQGSTALRHHLLGVGDRARRVEPFRARPGAIHDGMTTIKPERVFEPVETLGGVLIASVGKPTVRLQQNRWTKIAVGN